MCLPTSLNNYYFGQFYEDGKLGSYKLTISNPFNMILCIHCDTHFWRGAFLSAYFLPHNHCVITPHRFFPCNDLSSTVLVYCTSIYTSMEQYRSVVLKWRHSPWYAVEWLKEGPNCFRITTLTISTIPTESGQKQALRLNYFWFTRKWQASKITQEWQWHKMFISSQICFLDDCGCGSDDHSG